jgi:predicted SnoaL-like aldol condensation-catalyzing enzyme
VSTAHAGEALVRRLFDEVFNQRALDVCDEIVAADYVEHAIAPFGTAEPGAVDGPAHMRGVVDWLVAGYSDLTMRVEGVVSEGDLVATLVWSEGTNDGPLNGVVPPTGNRFAARQSHWYRVADGKLAEHWAVRDDLPTLLQLGVISRPGPPG